MKLHRDLLIPLVVVVAVLAVVTWPGEGGEPLRSASARLPEVRLAYFPNITHAPAIVGVARGCWRTKFKGARLSVKIVNAGPEAMEALLANELDFSFVGPSPAINAYIKSNGSALRVISGACLNGASLVRRSGSSIRRMEDLDGKRVAVPQIGGTQDVSCRYYLAKAGLRARDHGGTVDIVALKNPDILSLFKQGRLDAAWVPEPWAARLREEAGADSVFDESELWPGHKFCATLLIVRRAFMDAHPEFVEQAVAANAETIAWMRSHDREAREIVNTELKRLTGKPLKESVLKGAWSKVEFTSDPNFESIETFAEAARAAGYLASIPDLRPMVMQPPMAAKVNR